MTRSVIPSEARNLAGISYVVNFILGGIKDAKGRK